MRRMIAIAIFLTVGASWLLALADLRLGSGLGAAAAVALVTTLQGKNTRRSAILAGLIAGVLGAYLVHLAQQIIGPAWPGALPYARSALLAPGITLVAAALAIYDERRSKN